MSALARSRPPQPQGQGQDRTVAALIHECRHLRSSLPSLGTKIRVAFSALLTIAEVVSECKDDSWKARLSTYCSQKQYTSLSLSLWCSSVRCDTKALPSQARGANLEAVLAWDARKRIS
mmetsp:Transcript_43438/g.80840  ORF Transcript_43438/g.80840 Transcript_43438/m.80840 type:complete len:119 (-) Transcript_43438:1066-1422(-)